MKQLSQLTEEDFSRLANDIEELSSKSEKELYQVIGNGLFDLGYDVADTADSRIIKPMVPELENFSVKSAFEYVANNQSLVNEDAESKGKGFWGRFKDKLQHAICSDEKIKKLMTGQGSFKEYLIVGIPMVLAALGMGSLNPVLLAIVAATFALIIKVGWAAYCEIQ